MNYAMIGKIEKAKRYAEERHRFTFHKFEPSPSAATTTTTTSPSTTANFGITCDREFFLANGRYSPHDGARTPAQRHASRNSATPERTIE